jgi:hypothetical protein
MMRPFTPLGGVDSPSWWGLTMPRILIPKILVHVRYVYIALFIMPYLIHALHSIWGTTYPIPIFSLVVLRNFCWYFWGWLIKYVGWLLFYLGISKPLSLRMGLILPHMLGQDTISCLHKHVFFFFFFYLFCFLHFRYCMYFCLISHFIVHWLTMLI